MDRCTTWSRALVRLAPALSVLLGTVSLAGCGEDDSFGITSQPALAVAIEGKSQNPGQCFQFGKDSTGGQLPQTVELQITNVADDKVSKPKPLCVKATWQSTNSQLTMQVPSTAKALGATSVCGANYDYEIPVGKTLKLNLRYQADATEDATPAKLVLDTNDPKQKKAEYCIGIAAIGPLPELVPAEYRFVNASKANPPQQCFALYNKGSEELCFMGAALNPQNPQYAIVSQPNANACIAPLGQAGNLDGQTKLEVCVRYTPDDTLNNEDVKLVVSTDNSQEISQISAILQPEAKWRIECNCALETCPQLFAVTSDVKVATCKVINESDTPLKLQEVRVEPATQNGSQQAVDAVFLAEMVDFNDKVQSVYSLGKGKSVSLRLTYTPPSSGLPPKAVVRFGWSSANNNGDKFIAVQAGACDTPALEFGPTPALQMGAAVGQTATGTVVLANQSCGSMQVVNACVTAANVTGADPCAKSSTATFALATGFANTAVSAWGLLPLGLTFTPPNDNKLEINDLLHVFYCTGVWDGASCSGGTIERRALNLVGAVHTDAEVTSPSLQLVAPTAPEDLYTGKPVKLEAVVTPGSYDDARYFRWMVASRPDQSALWLPEGAQDTNTTPALVLHPDVPGEYKVLGWVQGVGSGGEFRWSPMAEVTFSVTKAPAP